MDLLFIFKPADPRTANCAARPPRAGRSYPRPDGAAASAPIKATWPRRLPRPGGAPARPRSRKEPLRRESAPSSPLAGSQSQVRFYGWGAVAIPVAREPKRPKTYS
eukprot:COSAG01_NODE_6452_length_3660_cov_2.580174_3_plen_106_part_00